MVLCLETDKHVKKYVVYKCIRHRQNEIKSEKRKVFSFTQVSF